jgi:predicted transposase YdaD
MAAKNNEDVAEAAILVKEFSDDQARRWHALSHEKFVRDVATREHVARAEGHEKGRQDERSERVRAALAYGLPAEQITEVLNIPPDEVTAIITQAEGTTKG